MSDKHFAYSGDPEARRPMHLVDEGFQEFKRTSAIAGFCHCLIHTGYLTINAMERHDCINKDCVFFEKFNDFPYWLNEQRKEQERLKNRKIKEKKKQRQERHQSALQEKTDKIFKAAETIAREYEYPIVITRVAPLKDERNNYKYIINYVSNYPGNDWYEYHTLAFILGYHYGGFYILRHTKKPNGEYATISDGENREGNTDVS